MAGPPRVAGRAWCILSEPGANGVWGVGIYENEYVKEGGVWKIAKLHFYPTAFTDYDRGWARSLLPMKGPSALFPPDKPPTKVYRTMPGNYIPPFSYKHPVTGAAADGSSAGRRQRDGAMNMKKTIILARSLCAAAATPAVSRSRRPRNWTPSMRASRAWRT